MASGPDEPFAEDDATIRDGWPLEEGGRVEAEPGHHPGPEVVDDHVDRSPISRLHQLQPSGLRRDRPGLPAC